MSKPKVNIVQSWCHFNLDLMGNDKTPKNTAKQGKMV